MAIAYECRFPVSINFGQIVNIGSELARNTLAYRRRTFDLLRRNIFGVMVSHSKCGHARPFILIFYCRFIIFGPFIICKKSHELQFECAKKLKNTEKTPYYQLLYTDLMIP